MRCHAFVDESARPGRYLIAVVLVPSHRLVAVTREVKGLFPRGNRRTHLSAEGKARRRMLLKAYGQVSVEARVLSVPHAGGDDQPAREACLGALVTCAPEWGVGMLVLDSRGPHRDARDRRFIARSVLRGTSTCTTPIGAAGTSRFCACLTQWDGRSAPAGHGASSSTRSSLR